MSNWHAELNENKSNLNENVELYNIYGYERFLACYRSASSHGAAGEIGVDREKRKVIMEPDLEQKLYVPMEYVIPLGLIQTAATILIYKSIKNNKN